MSIDAEELRIGPRGVHVSYVFANRGTRDVRSKVAFSVPLPVCDEKHAAECAWILPLGAGPNPTRFKVFVDGGYRMKAPVRAIVKSPRYRAGNDRR